MFEFMILYLMEGQRYQCYNPNDSKIFFGRISYVRRQFKDPENVSAFDQSM